MKKIISIAFAAILAGFAISCQKEEVVSDKTDAVQYTFNITVNDRSGFDNGASTKGDATYKSAWANGDKIFLFFKPTEGSLLDDKYATLTYNGSSWDGTVSSGTSSLGDGGTLSAVYVYKLGSNVTPSYSDSKWIIATGNTFYNCETEVTYTVSDNVISASLNLKAPTNFVRFYVEGATGALTCDNVKGWKDIAIGSDMSVSNVTCTGYMDGFTNSGDQNVKEYYGRIVNNEISLEDQDCKFSVVKDGKVYERTATPSSDARSFKMTVSTPDWQEAEGKLPGLFTVGIGADGKAGTADDVKVRFSQGNLYYDGSKFNFEANQYDFRTYAGKNSCINGASSTTGTPSDHWGLFGWSTASTTYGISTSTSSSSYSGDFVDWGKAYCEKNSITPDNTWRTLSKDEWTYLFNTRTASTVSGTANARYAKATVNSKAGVILLPDTYAHPEGVTALTNINTAEAAFTANEYDSTNWEKMESAGAVFLPAAGRRNGSNVSSVGNEGDYWSSTANGTSGAYRMYFKSDNVSPDANGNRNTGYGVRLITESK